MNIIQKYKKLSTQKKIAFWVLVLILDIWISLTLAMLGLAIHKTYALIGAILFFVPFITASIWLIIGSIKTLK